MTHTADKVLQIAMQAERLGQTFYENFALGCGSEQLAALANQLAAEEKKHLETFKKMHDSLPDNQKGPKLTEDQLQELAGKDYKLILPTPADVRHVAMKGDLAEALDLAIKMESDSIHYYQTQVSVLGADINILQTIIEEEQRHLTQFKFQKNNLPLANR